MPIGDNGELEDTLERMWESHRGYLRRMLIGLSRDVDLAEDLLQETYLHARSGLSGYRGGDPRAWLAAIARNSFYAHARRRSFHNEGCLEADPPSEGYLEVGSPDHLTRLQVRAAIENLDPGHRAALLMKHYGGFTYPEIGAHLGCPAGTARRRVWTALQRLRATLYAGGEEGPDMKTAHPGSAAMLGFVYGSLKKERAKQIRAHLGGCSACREEIRELEKTVRALDAAEGDYRTVQVIDLDAAGVPTHYDWASMTNNYGQPMGSYWCTMDKEYNVDYAMVQGQEVIVEMLPSSDRQWRYWTSLPRPVEPGGRTDSLMVFHLAEPKGRAEKLENGRWRFSHETSPNTRYDWVYGLALRLPPGAKLLGADPEPNETKSKRATTLIWRRMLEKIADLSHGDMQFRCSVEYGLDPAATVAAEAGAAQTPASGIVRRGPEVVFEIDRSPWMGAGEKARDLFARAREIEPSPAYIQTWYKLGVMLYDGGFYEEALEAMRRAGERYEPPYRTFAFGALVWQGHALDLLGRREEALERYREALAIDIGDDYIEHGRLKMVLNSAWAEERLKTPFQRQ